MRYYKADVERSFRITLSKMLDAHQELLRIRGDIFDNPHMVTAEACLAESIEQFTDARDAAAQEMGFAISPSMPT